MFDTVLIPKDRIAVLIGPGGKVKKQIEKIGKCKLSIDSQENEVTVDAQEAVDLWLASQVVEAIGRGFSPEIAQKIFKENFSYEKISITDYAGNSDKKLRRLRGRVIGQQGKSRRRIAFETGTDVVVYGKTVGIIGPDDRVPIARKAIDMLLSGAQHAKVFKFIEKQMEEINGRKTDSQ